MKVEACSTRDRRQAVVPSRAETRANYDRLSRWYDLLAGGFENRYKQEAIGLLDVRTGDRVLELGPGTGYALVRLAHSVGETGKVYGVELSPGMLARARDRIEKSRLTDRIMLIQGDAAELPFPDGQFDAAFSSFVLELFGAPGIQRVLSECRRVLRPAGRLAVVSLSSEGPRTLALRLYEWSHRRWPRLVDCRPILPAEELVRAGFAVLTRRTRPMWGLAVDIVIARKPVIDSRTTPVSGTGASEREVTPVDPM